MSKASASTPLAAESSGIQEDRECDRRQHRHHPGHQAVAALAAVEGPLERRGPGAKRAGEALTLAERAPLLDQQRGDDGKDTHASILLRLTSMPAVAPQITRPWYSNT